MPNCYKHDGISIEWEIGIDCPFCSVLNERADLQEQLGRAVSETLAVRNKFQEIMEDLADSKPSVPASRGRRGRVQVPSANSYEDIPDLDDED